MSDQEISILELPKVLNDDLEILASKINGNKLDVIKKALILFKIAVESSEHKMKFAIVDQDKNILSEISGIIN